MDSDRLPNLETTMNKILVKLMNGYLSIDYPSPNFMIFTPPNKPKTTTNL